LELLAFNNTTCGGTPALWLEREVELPPDGVWKTVDHTIDAPAGTASLQIRLRVVADDDAGLLQYATHSAQWDNVVLHAR